MNVAKWANHAGELPSALIQRLADLAKQDVLRFEVDYKPTLAFQVQPWASLSHYIVVWLCASACSTTIVMLPLSGAASH